MKIRNFLPRRYDRKIVVRFAIFPVIIDHTLIWLEIYEKDFEYKIEDGKKKGKWILKNKKVRVNNDGNNKYDEKHAPHGLWKSFGDNGDLTTEYNYSHGSLHGYYNSYVDKKKWLETVYENGTIEGEYIVHEVHGARRVRRRIL
jgi:hypothetical protein